MTPVVTKMLSMEALISSHLLSLWGCWCIEKVGDFDLTKVFVRGLSIPLQNFQLTKRIYSTLRALDHLVRTEVRGG